MCYTQLTCDMTKFRDVRYLWSMTWWTTQNCILTKILLILMPLGSSAKFCPDTLGNHQAIAIWQNQLAKWQGSANNTRPRLEWAQIWSRNLRSICGYWTRPIWGLKVNYRFHDKLRSELADHEGFPTIFHQFRSQGLVFWWCTGDCDTLDQFNTLTPVKIDTRQIKL